MAFLDRFRKVEQRQSLENPAVPISSPNIISFLGEFGPSATGINVTVENALGVPAVWAAVQFLSGTLAGLPLHVYRKTDQGRERESGTLEKILHDAVTESMSSFEWRKYSMERTLTGGRSLTYIERDGAGRIANLYPVDPSKVTITQDTKLRKVYTYKSESMTVVYQAADIIDIPFMLRSDTVTAVSPINQCRDAIGLAIASTRYGSKFFLNGGVPPFVMTGNFQSGAALKRASADLESAIKEATKDARLALSLPSGHEIKTLGVDPEKSQLNELNRFLIEEVARIYSLPPVFLQDLTRGTFSNTEQQDLHLVKHTIRRWVQQFEQEMNLKLFGRSETSRYVEFNLDGLLRGDFSSRMSGYATGVQNAILTPNEARSLENRPSMEGGDDLMIQGATVPIGSQPTEDDSDDV